MTGIDVHPDRRVIYALMALLVTAGCPAPPSDEFSITLVTPGPGTIELDSIGEPVTPLHGGLLASRETVGAFEVVVERYPQARPIPFIYIPSARVHLSVETPDRRVYVALTDDGATLRTSAQSPGCFGGASYLQYRSNDYRSDDETHLLAIMDTTLNALVGSCGRWMENPSQVRGMLGRAKGDFREASRVFKARVIEAFGTRMERGTPPAPGTVW